MFFISVLILFIRAALSSFSLAWVVRDLRLPRASQASSSRMASRLRARKGTCTLSNGEPILRANKALRAIFAVSPCEPQRNWIGIGIASSCKKVIADNQDFEH
ncbi:hypothetical protein BDV29DRAFT_41522 [Aspergillus leporis]|jgi:hypothetical protein|uniref:Secreted protein n=1 Tax=Aspergillus leporis TaxID=41062 RepID=A0A5N5XC97_9EURO|nr:hypothetical protein BDV29DRAFT_41522 [Aspergillus leporis]